MMPERIARWDEDETKYEERLFLRADSFRPERLFYVKPSLDWLDGIASPGGNYGYANRILPSGTSLKFSLSPSREGKVKFDGDVVIPTLFDLGGPFPEPWMSFTPMEVITQRPGIRRAHGTVLVGGLGLGWFLRKVHDRPEVERVILVESCGELLDWYGDDVCGRLPKVTDVICGDVLTSDPDSLGYEMVGQGFAVPGGIPGGFLPRCEPEGHSCRGPQFRARRPRPEQLAGRGLTLAVQAGTGFRRVEDLGDEVLAAIEVHGGLHLPPVIVAVDELLAVPRQGMDRTGHPCRGRDHDLRRPRLATDDGVSQRPLGWRGEQQRCGDDQGDRPQLDEHHHGGDFG